jgi:hypothetical protein
MTDWTTEELTKIGAAEELTITSVRRDGTVYRAKYRRYAASIVGSILTPAARSAALRLKPR